MIISRDKKTIILFLETSSTLAILKNKPKKVIEDAIKKVEEVVKGDDKDAIDEAVKILSEASSGLAQKMYAEQTAEAQPGQEESKPADDAMDAEFEEVKEDGEDKSKEEKN